MGWGYIYEIIISPIVTEKTNLQSSENKFTFKIKDFATKIDVEKAVKEIFGVDVIKINIVNTKGKTKRFRGRIGKKSNIKKAIVTMKKGQQIDLTKLEGK